MKQRVSKVRFVRQKVREARPAYQPLPVHAVLTLPRLSPGTPEVVWSPSGGAWDQVLADLAAARSDMTSPGTRSAAAADGIHAHPPGPRHGGKVMARVDELVLLFRPTPNRRRRDPIIAAHEAGHAVCAVRFGWHIQCATIVPDLAPAYGEAYEGRVVLRLPRRRISAFNSTFWSGRRLGVEDLLIRFAGPAAQRRAAPRSGIPAAAQGDHQLAATILSLAAASPESERALRRHLYFQARDMVADNWLEIEAVKALLLDRRKVRHAQIAAEIDRVAEKRAQHASALAEDMPRLEKMVEELRFRRRRAEPVPRRILANAVFRAAIESLANNEPLTEPVLRRYVEGESFWRNVDPTTAMEKLDRILERHRQRFAWRPVVATP